MSAESQGTAPKGAGGGRYAEADALILQRIAGGATTFSSIWSGLGMQYRAVDRRLQSLRKRGLIRFHKGHWHLTDAALAKAGGEQSAEWLEIPAFLRRGND